jgi:hypothetical protein
LVVAALCCIPAISIAASDDPKEIERLLAKVRNEPIIFILATGEPNACGRGCSEWIAGEGQFDESAAQRFRDFLAALPKRDLPIFFNSDGGLLREAVQIGSLQRNRLSAAARFRRRGNDLRAFHSLRVGKAGGELLRGSPPLSGASVLSASRLEPLAPCMGLSESSRDLSSPPLSFVPSLCSTGVFVPTRASLTSARRSRQSWPSHTNLAACSAFATTP